MILAPVISVIVPAYRAPTLPECVERLLAQRVDEPFEVIVCVSADEEHELPRLRPDPRLQVLASAPRLAASVARNRAVAASSGRALVFTDADAFADPYWLAELVQRSDGVCCVAGAVLNGTPDRVAGTAEYLVEFIDLHPRRPADSLWHGATCNLFVPRALWQELGPFAENLNGGEDTMLTVAAHRSGRLRFAPKAHIYHQNRTRWPEVMRHQVEFGRFTARLARRSPYRWRPLVRYSPLAPVAWLGRLFALYLRLLQADRRAMRRAILLFPVLAALLAGWAWGLFVEGVRLDLPRMRAR